MRNDIKVFTAQGVSLRYQAVSLRSRSLSQERPENEEHTQPVDKTTHNKQQQQQTNTTTYKGNYLKQLKQSE